MSNKSKFLGYVSARLISQTAPERTDVLWAKPTSVQDGNQLYTLYFWNGTDWVELGTGSGGGSGTYDTTLPEGVLTPFDLGGIPANTDVETLRGLPFTTLWDMLLFPTQAPTYTPPGAVLTGSGQKLVQVGDQISPVLSATFQQHDAGAKTSYNLFKNGSSFSQQETYTDTNATLGSPGVIEYQGKYGYAEGPVKNDNHGNPHPGGRIQAGDVYTGTESYRWVYPFYFGSSLTNGGSIDPTTGTKQLAIIGSSLTVAFPNDGAKFYWLAVPAGINIFTTYFITEISKGPIGPGNAWEPPLDISVTDGNFTGVPYKLYVTGYETAFNLPVKFES